MEWTAIMRIISAVIGICSMIISLIILNLFWKEKNKEQKFANVEQWKKRWRIGIITAILGALSLIMYRCL